MLTLSQIGWASEHDWFVRVSDCGNGVVVAEEVLGEDIKLMTFHDFEALRTWAGY